uniref:Uncharacterized protein n=1 Tax=viral metagenome TaxID=1070528 RepID=A0A6C0HA81_9ZZZZ
MSYKKFFSNNNENSYNDYLKIKKGREMIKKSVSNKKYRLNTFINYETFLTLTKAYYNNLNNKNHIGPPVSITNSNTSLLKYRSILNHLHNDNCYYCNKCPIEEIVNCKYVANILYPYGESIIKNDPLENIFYPHSINLDLYCKKCPFPCVETCEIIHYQSCGPYSSCNQGCGNRCDTGCGNRCDTGCGNRCDTGCGKTRPLFFKEKQVCRCSKSSKCEKCNDH